MKGKENEVIDSEEIKVIETITPAKKPRKPRKQKIVEPSKYLIPDETVPLFGIRSKLCTYREWVHLCHEIQKTDYFAKLYKKQTFKHDDIINTGFIYPVWLKEPEDRIDQITGKVLETIPGVYDEDKTMVLPPKFFFIAYKRYLYGYGVYDKYLKDPTVMDFPKVEFKMKFEPREEQQELAKIATKKYKENKCFRGITQCPPGWGKSEDLDTIIPTPNGHKRFGDLIVGDKVFAKDGSQTEVTAIYPQGEIDSYKITFGDGTSSIFGLEHLWTVWDTDSKKWRTITTKEILSKNYARPEKDKRYGDKSNCMRYKYFIPLCEPVQYENRVGTVTDSSGLNPSQFHLHPYAMGLLLGDGSFRRQDNGIGFTDKFSKNIKKLKSSLEENGFIDDLYIGQLGSGGENTFKLVSPKLKHLTKLFELDLKYSIEKHIPRVYLEGSIESRKLLLKGLIDTDGYVRTKTSWSYSTSSEQLKDDVCELARSLGYYVTIKINKNNTYEHKGEKKQSKNTNYELCINYKKERKAICKIEKLEPRAQQCITVNNPEHLYLTKDFTVTHNTYISIKNGCTSNGQILIVVPNLLLQDQWIKSICDFTDLTEEDIGIIQGSKLETLTKKGVMTKPIIIAKIQSLESQLKRIEPETLFDFYENIATVFYDETHTSGGADGYGKTTGIFTTLSINGLSATPYKKGKNLFQLYTGIGTIEYISTHQNLIPNCNMHLVPAIISTRDSSNLMNLLQKNYNLAMTTLEELLYKDDKYFDYLCDWVEYRLHEGHNIIIIFKTIKMIEKLQRVMETRAKPIEGSVILIGSKNGKKLKKEEKAELEKKLNATRIILSNYKMFSAGADYPHLSCVFFASMILGEIPIIQTLGRVTRKYAEKLQNVQAHFFLAKFIFPGFSTREPQQTIMKAVKLQYPTAKFTWDDEFKKYFQEKKDAAENLNAGVYQNYQQSQGYVPGNQPNLAINASHSDQNRLSVYQQQMNNGGQGINRQQQANPGMPGLPVPQSPQSSQGGMPNPFGNIPQPPNPNKL